VEATITIENDKEASIPVNELIIPDDFSALNVRAEWTKVLGSVLRLVQVMITNGSDITQTLNILAHWLNILSQDQNSEEDEVIVSLSNNSATTSIGNQYDFGKAFIPRLVRSTLEMRKNCSIASTKGE